MSHETTYQSLFIQRKGSLRKEVVALFVSFLVWAESAQPRLRYASVAGYGKERAADTFPD